MYIAWIFFPADGVWPYDVTCTICPMFPQKIYGHLTLKSLNHQILATYLYTSLQTFLELQCTQNPFARSHSLARLSSTNEIYLSQCEVRAKKSIYIETRINDLTAIRCYFSTFMVIHAISLRTCHAYWLFWVENVSVCSAGLTELALFRRWSTSGYTKRTITRNAKICPVHKADKILQTQNRECFGVQQAQNLTHFRGEER